MPNTLNESHACDGRLADDCVDCGDVSSSIQETYFEIPRDLPTAKAALCALADVVSEMEDDEHERPLHTLQSRQSIAIGCGCDLWNPEGCGCRFL